MSNPDKAQEIDKNNRINSKDRDVKADQQKLDRQCEIILEQIRLEILEPKEALEKLKEFYFNWRYEK